MQNCLLLLANSNSKSCALVFILCILGHIRSVFNMIRDILVYSYKL